MRRGAATLLLEEQTYKEEADERLNWPSVTLHIAASELGVMGETGERWRGWMDVRGGGRGGPPSFTLIL